MNSWPTSFFIMNIVFCRLTPTFTMSGAPQPDGGALERCSQIILRDLHSTSHWHDVPCASKNSNQFICEKAAYKGIRVLCMAQEGYKGPQPTFVCPKPSAYKWEFISVFAERHGNIYLDLKIFLNTG